MWRATWLSGLLLAAIVPAVRAGENPAGDSGKPGNWLVDAMADKPDEPRHEFSVGVAHPANRQFGRPTSPYSLPQDRNANPLSSYLATWMTPRDIEILQIKPAADATPGRIMSSEQHRLAASGAAAAPQQNPYLVELAAPSAAPKTAAVAPVPAPPSLAPAVPKNDAAPAKTAGPPPDLVKSQDEQKYFPQLKRF